MQVTRTLTQRRVSAMGAALVVGLTALLSLPGASAGLKDALVVDCGGKHAQEMAHDADLMYDYLRAEGYRTVLHVSQTNELCGLRPSFKDGDYEGLSGQLRFYIDKFIAEYSKRIDEEPEEEYVFFLYLAAHGSKGDPSFAIHPHAETTGDPEWVLFFTLGQWLDGFPPAVELRVFIDTCYSGLAVRPLKLLETRRRKPCSVLIMTSTDEESTTTAGTPGFLNVVELDTAVEDFMEGASLDPNKNKVKGDLGDRFMRMDSEGDGKPEIYYSSEFGKLHEKEYELQLCE